METSRDRTKHTPTPWEIDATDEGRRDIFGPYRGRHQLIVTAYREERGRNTIDDGAEAEANAEFIVRAVNAHDELVAALKEERERLFKHFQQEQREAFVKGLSMDLWPEIKRIDAVISKAEGR